MFTFHRIMFKIVVLPLLSIPHLFQALVLQCAWAHWIQHRFKEGHNKCQCKRRCNRTLLKYKTHLSMWPLNRITVFLMLWPRGTTTLSWQKGKWWFSFIEYPKKWVISHERQREWLTRGPGDLYDVWCGQLDMMGAPPTQCSRCPLTLLSNCAPSTIE